MCAFFDDLHSFAHYKYTPECVIRIAVSCFFALGVNISNYLVLGKTSPLTYQVRICCCCVCVRLCVFWREVKAVPCDFDLFSLFPSLFLNFEFLNFNSLYSLSLHRCWAI